MARTKYRLRLWVSKTISKSKSWGLPGVARYPKESTDPPLQHSESKSLTFLTWHVLKDPRVKVLSTSSDVKTMSNFGLYSLEEM